MKEDIIIGQNFETKTTVSDVMDIVSPYFVRQTLSWSRDCLDYVLRANLQHCAGVAAYVIWTCKNQNSNADKSHHRTLFLLECGRILGLRKVIHSPYDVTGLREETVEEKKFKSVSVVLE
ncbi:hypothetical protein T4C_11407, partial [Trichinella pseudospiralis]